MQTKQEKLEKLQSLVNKFNQHIDNYKNPNYNETALRLEFLNPFFEILDWDVRNEENNHLNYTDVIVEERIDVYGSDNKKAPDYTFRIGGTKKFFVEAKKPSIDIKDAFEPAFQVRRYGHSAGLCLSILTDFEELSVYDTRKKPNKNDKPTKDRILYYKYTDYIEKFDEIYNLFSKTAIKQGSFEKFEKDDKHRKGNESIDEGILELVNDFREKLAKNIIKSNTNIDVPALNKAVIKIIDRLFFLRIAEDKEVEPYKTLFNITSHPNIYENLKKIFKESDRRYNSELFKYFKDIDGLIIEDKILKEIIINLYTPECVYEFSQIPVSILGSMYEQFLGKTIRITDGGHVKIEEKPEVKKAGGVYYTPEYIVNYIVKNTVGEKIKGLTPKEIEKIKILDPACGSGSFLIGAYQYLLDYHLAYYTDEKNLQKSIKLKLIRETRNGYILSIPEKQRILINNIFGVDIDQQAVEVAKFSLLLKLMESEDRETKSSISPTGEKEYQDDFNITGQIYHNMKILPNLNNNIKCGNSLIGTDYYNAINMELFEKDDYNKINAFDWDKEFSEIFKSGGFDCVIGNPPYIRTDIISDNIKNYIAKQYISAKGKYDLYYLFVERSLFLINSKGFFSFIIPNRFTTSDSGYELRNLIINNVKKIYINSLSSIRVFKKASVYPNILIVKEKDTFAEKLEIQITSVQSELYLTDNNLVLTMRDIKLLPNYIFPINCSLGILKIFFKLSKIQKLSDILMIQEGLRIPPDLENNNKGLHIVKQYQFCRYSPIITGSFITEKDLTKCVSKTSSRFINCNKDKIIFAEDALRIEAIFDNSHSLCQGGVYFATLLECTINLKFLLGLLNSKLLTCIYKNLFAGMHMGGGYLRFRTSFLNQLPIIKIDCSNKIDKIKHDKMIELVEQMLEIQKQLHSAKTESDKQFYQKKSGIIDKQIDSLVYELYGLTQEEIKVIENN